MAKNRSQKLMENTVLIAVGQFGSKVLVYLLTKVYTSLMNESEFSVANNIMDFAALLIPLLSLGLGEAIFRLAKGGEFGPKEVFSDAFAIWGMGSLLIAAIAPALLAVPYFSDYVLLILFYAMASIFHTVCTNYIRSKGKVRLYAVQGILNTVLVILLNLLFLIPLKMSSVGFVLSVPIADVAVTLLIFAKEKLWNDFSLRAIHAAPIRRMLRYSVPLIPTTVFMWVINLSDRLMVTYFCGDSVNGLLSAAYKIPTLLGIMNSIFLYAWQISAMDEKNSLDKRAYYSSVFRSYSSLLYVMGGAILFGCRLIARLMFASQYRQAWIFIPILTVAIAVHNLASYLDSENMVRMKSLPTMFTALAGAVVNVILNLTLIPLFAGYSPLYGGIGAAIATLASYLVTFISRAIIVRDSIQVRVATTVGNLLILSCMAFVTMAAWPIHWIVLDGLFMLSLLLLNGRPLWEMARSVVSAGLRMIKARR